MGKYKFPPNTKNLLTCSSVLHHDDGTEEHEDLHLSLCEHKHDFTGACRVNQSVHIGLCFDPKC